MVGKREAGYEVPQKLLVELITSHHEHHLELRILLQPNTDISTSVHTAGVVRFYELTQRLLTWTSLVECTYASVRLNGPYVLTLQTNGCAFVT